MCRVFLLAGLVALAFGVSGCAAGADHPFAPAAPQPIAQGPALKPGDKLNVAIAGEDELDGQYIVEEDRTVAIPLIGSVTADGDVAAFRARLSQKLIKGLLGNPTVTVTLAANPPPAGLLPPPGIRPTDGAIDSY